MIVYGSLVAVIDVSCACGYVVFVVFIHVWERGAVGKRVRRKVVR